MYANIGLVCGAARIVSDICAMLTAEHHVNSASYQCAELIKDCTDVSSYYIFVMFVTLLVRLTSVAVCATAHSLRHITPSSCMSALSDHEVLAFLCICYVHA